jgi:hypothetical protein
LDTDAIEKEITSTIRQILLSKGVYESGIRIKTKTKMTTAKMPVRAQGVKDGKEIVEWPKTALAMVKMKLTVEFAAP